MDQIINTILQNTYTLSQFKKRLQILQSTFQQQFFHSLITENLTPKDNQWLQSLPKSFMDAFNKDNLTQNLSSLSSKINSTPILTVYLPIDVSDEVLDQIGNKVRQNFGANLLLDVKYNPILIAGCALSWKGIYKDYSLHSKIAERRLAILQSFKKFLR